MARIKVSIPEDLKRTMEKYSEINWPEFIRKCIHEKTRQLSWEEEMLKKLEHDKEFEQRTIEMGKKMNKKSAERLKKERLL